MEIIKKTDPTKWKTQCDCNTCKSTLMIDFGDLMIQPGYSDFREMNPDTVYFVCPVCKTYNHKMMSFVPREFHFALPRAKVE